MAANFTAADVQQLRRTTGAGMMDAKNALVSCDGDPEAAAQMLRETGVAKSLSRSDRDNREGIVMGDVVHSPSADNGEGNGAGEAAGTAAAQIGAIVELRCETDFVAKSSAFAELAKDLLQAVLADGPEAVASKQADIDDLKITHKENIEVGRIERFEAAAGEVLDIYVHQQNGRGVNAVMVHIAAANPGTDTTAHDIALHIASSRPKYLTREDIPAEVIEQERATFEAMSRNEGKPEAALPKIIEGRLNGFYRDNSLLEQKFVKDEKRTIKDLLGSTTLKQFTQIEIGT